MVVSALVVFLYGSIMWGIFPLKTEISWEGHLFGALAGILVAFNYRKEGPQRRIYHWEEEDDDNFSEEFPNDVDVNDAEITSPINDFKINFIYKEKDKNEN